jgi:hypothetical protein
MQPFIAQAVNLVVSITRAGGAAGRRVRKLIRVEDFADGVYRTTRV